MQVFFFPRQAAASCFFSGLETEKTPLPRSGQRGLRGLPAPPAPLGPTDPEAGAGSPCPRRCITGRSLSCQRRSRLPQEGVQPQTPDPPVHLRLETEERMKETETRRRHSGLQFWEKPCPQGATTGSRSDGSRSVAPGARRGPHGSATGSGAAPFRDSGKTPFASRFASGSEWS